MRRASAHATVAASALALGVTLLTSPVAGQGASAASTTSATRKGRFHLGPLWLTPKVVLRNAGGDTNVFNDADQPVSDNSAVLEPSADALLPLGRRLRVLGRGGIGFNYFQREEEERSTDLWGETRAELDVGPSTLWGGLRAAERKQRFSLEVDERLERKERSYGGGVDLKLGRRLKLGGRAEQSEYRYQQGVPVGGNLVDRSLDRDVLTYIGSLSYSLTPRTALVFDAELVEDTFQDVLVGEDTARSSRYIGGFSFTAGGLFAGDARVGWRHFPRTDTQVVPAYDGVALAVDVTTHVGPLGALALLASRDVYYAVERAPTPLGRTRNSYVAGHYSATFNTELPASWLLRTSLAYDRSTYVLPYVEEGLPLDRVDDLRTLGLGLFRAFGSTFRVGGTIEWSQRTSNLGGFGYERRVYGVSAEYTP